MSERDDRCFLNTLVKKLWEEKTLAVRTVHGRKPKNKKGTDYPALTPDKLKFVKSNFNSYFLV